MPPEKKISWRAPAEKRYPRPDPGYPMSEQPVELNIRPATLSDFLTGTVVIRKEAPASRLSGAAPATATSA